ncbi:MAG: hypothetical protein RIB98_08185 [Acidimicrobiales bacterium]
MAATLTPDSNHHVPATTTTPAVTRPTSHHVLIILHAEFDSDDTLVEFAQRLGPDDRVTLANIRPAGAAPIPPSGVMSDLGMMIYLDTRDTYNEESSLLDMRVSARSRLLRELGVDHEVVTEIYHRSVLDRVTQRGLRKAIGRAARHARADEIMVGPGAILQSQKLG